MIYLIGITLSFFLGFILLSKKSKSSADYILFCWLTVIGFHLLSYYLFFTQQFSNYLTLIAIGLPLSLAHGPFLYLYTHFSTSENSFKTKYLLHFVPLMIIYLVYYNFFLLPFEQKVEVFLNNDNSTFHIQKKLRVYLTYCSGIIYVIFSLVELHKYRKNLIHKFSNQDKINFNWLLYLILWISAIWVVVIFVKDSKFVFSAASLFVCWLGYFGIKQVNVFKQHSGNNFNEHTQHSTLANNTATTVTGTLTAPSSNNYSEKYRTSPLTSSDINELHLKLKQILAQEKPFINPDLSLNDLANMLNTHPNHLSQVINSMENKNFYDLINERRIFEFIENYPKPENQRYTLLGFALSCGFNSKASFNRNFKKHTGKTPSEYFNSLTSIS